jgi:DNA-binding response OmpR family regulator
MTTIRRDSPRESCHHVVMAGRILLVEDDATIGDVLTSSLRSHAYEVSWEQTGRGGLACAGAGPVDLILLDLGLPDLDGVEVCRQLRHLQPGCVLVMLTARSSEMDVVVGLEAGADDYLVKPVRLAEFHARIRAHLRRNGGGATGPAVRTLGDLVVDMTRHQVTIAGRELRLRPKEFDLLARLAAEPEVAHSREQLMSDVWDENWFGSTKTLDVHIAALRRRLQEADPEAAARTPRIITVRGHGYRLELPTSDGAGA